MYRPRDAEHTVLHQVIAAHLDAFLGAVAEAGDGAGLPQFVEREFAIDVLACAHCGCRLRLIGTLHDPAVIRRILANVGMAPSGPSPGPAPPESGAAAP